MNKTISSFFILFLCVGITASYAQQRDTVSVEWLGVEVPSLNLEFKSPVLEGGASEKQERSGADINRRNLDNFQKEIMARVADIYQANAGAIQAQINNNPLEAERHINQALTDLQSLLDDYPEIQSDRRFTEVYRSVMAEYREFYGIQNPAQEAVGEVFAIQKEIMNADDDISVENYAIPENVSTPKMEVPLVQNRQVSRHLVYYTLRRPEVMEKWLERSEKYFPMMEKIFREEGVPTELIHLSMIESGLNPTARSWASAVGMWQFIRATGSMYGLEVNWWLDERRDPEKATRAAARHLKDLYNIWGDWHLAMANYNISPRGLKRAIRAAGGVEDYWEAYPYLPRETRGYVPGFIAATMIGTNPVAFGFEKAYGAEPYSYEVYEVDPLMPLDELANAAGITTEKLKEYNPELLRWATPPGAKYPLKLPSGSAKQQLASNYDSIPKENRSQNVAMHTVQRGETLGYIARKYGTSVRAIYETNENLSSTIYPNQKIVVPLAPGSMEKIAASRPTNQPRSSSSRRTSRASAPANSSKMVYSVKTGDTIGHIAEWYDVRAWQIRSWNNTSNTIRVGERLTVYVPESKAAYYRQVDDMSFSQKQKIEREQRAGKDVTKVYLASAGSDTGTLQYRVRKNDTLIDIANSFGVTVSELKRMNNLKGSRIYVGQTLKINKPN